MKHIGQTSFALHAWIACSIQYMYWLIVQCSFVLQVLINWSVHVLHCCLLSQCNIAYLILCPMQCSIIDCLHYISWLGINAKYILCITLIFNVFDNTNLFLWGSRNWESSCKSLYSSFVVTTYSVLKGIIHFQSVKGKKCDS